MWTVQFQGTGTIYYYDPDGKIYFIYTGDIRNDMPHGQGLYIEGQSQCEGRFFEYEFIEGKCTTGHETNTGTFSTDKKVWIHRKGTKEYFVTDSYHWKLKVAGMKMEIQKMNYCGQA